MSAARPTASRTRGLDKPRPPASVTPAITHEIVLGKFNDTDWNLMLDRDGNEEFIAEIVDDLIDTTMALIFKKYLDRQLIPFTISQAKDALVEIIEWQFLARDEGEQNITSDPGWAQDTEPEPAETDCCAQGSIPKNFIAAPPKVLLMEIPEVPEGEAVAEVSASPVEAVPQEPAELPDAVSDTEEVPPENVKHTEAQMKVEESPSSSRQLELKFYEGDTKTKSKRSRTKTVSSDSIDMQRQHEEVAESVDKPCTFQKEPNSCSSFIKSLLGHHVGTKDAVYDEMGYVLAVPKLDPEKLPTHKVIVKYTIVEAVKDAVQVKADSKKRNLAANKQKDRAVVTETYNKGSQSKSFLSKTSTVKPLSTSMIEEIEVSQGIIVREGGRVKTGPGRYYRKLDFLEESQKGMKPVSLRITDPGITVADLLDRPSPILRPFAASSPLPPIVPHTHQQAKQLS